MSDIKWWSLEGERTSLYGKCKTRFFKVHIGAGRIWWAYELGRDRTPLRSAIFDGPEAARRAHKWCDEQCKRPKPRRRQR